MGGRTRSTMGAWRAQITKSKRSIAKLMVTATRSFSFSGFWDFTNLGTHLPDEPHFAEGRGVESEGSLVEDGEACGRGYL